LSWVRPPLTVIPVLYTMVETRREKRAERRISRETPLRSAVSEPVPVP